MVIGEALEKGLKYLENSEYTNPFLEVKVILSHLLNKDISYFISHSEDELDIEVEKEYLEILNRRKQGEPLQYILGEVNFYGRDFYIDNNVLIPRNDTEISVDVLREIFKNNKIDKFLEIGCGTGVVSITMALMNECADFLAVDISEYAIKNTIKNINKYDLKNISVIQSNLYSNVTGSYDIIYSNPPYIRTEEIKNLQAEVKNFEPILALDGGCDGLYFYRKIIEGAKNRLNKNGFLVFEIGYDQAEDLKIILKDYEIKVFKDLAQKDRVIVAYKGA
ncbi:peptide chain release factor N(5)-glutamine methyltransferase [Anaerosphaera multitolerans]|uniref:Release factor glutamine methyltransferase n=1 Tax=Anaerosphaera multitolerans TaxID=2487351 RepID=A0A437S8P9_9FIRM|nr:peptide chain release factor N(5)-glutamine methyltransferase [Anaerosphaera multitolerans]RVU55218.1 peptide chain release factor N(5)-glutamine methyltransferase [Anaerosphaera multitolerans]